MDFSAGSGKGPAYIIIPVFGIPSGMGWLLSKINIRSDPKAVILGRKLLGSHEPYYFLPNVPHILIFI